MERTTLDSAQGEMNWYDSYRAALLETDSDILSNDAAWRKLCHLALCEVDSVKLLERIAVARSAVIDHLDRFPNLSFAEQKALYEALEMLIMLQNISIDSENQTVLS